MATAAVRYDALTLLDCLVVPGSEATKVQSVTIYTHVLLTCHINCIKGCITNISDTIIRLIGKLSSLAYENLHHLNKGRMIKWKIITEMGCLCEEILQGYQED